MTVNKCRTIKTMFQELIGFWWFLSNSMECVCVYFNLMHLKKEHCALLTKQDFIWAEQYSFIMLTCIRGGGYHWSPLIQGFTVLGILFLSNMADSRIKSTASLWKRWLKTSLSGWPDDRVRDWPTPRCLVSWAALSSQAPNVSMTKGQKIIPSW